MAVLKIKRQSVTSPGLIRRIQDADLGAVADPRRQSGVRFDVRGMLGLVAMSMASGGIALRSMERRSEQLLATSRSAIGLPEARVADNTIGALARVLDPSDLRVALRRSVKLEHRRGNLAAARLSSGLQVAAIDGKGASTLRWQDLWRAARVELAAADDERTKVADWIPSEDDVRAVFATRFDWVQLVKSGDDPMYGLIRNHRSTLVSATAAVCLDVRPIPGSTNEIGAICDAVTELLSTYRHTGLIDLVTADAGNTSLAVGNLIVKHNKHYFLAIKEPQGTVHAEAVARLDGANARRADFTASEQRGGEVVAYSVWVEELPKGIAAWGHARQLVRVERVCAGDEGEPTIGNRYFVTSLSRIRLPYADALRLSRMHWRCENEGHWTSDVYFKEDARRAVGSRHPIGMLVLGVVRMIAQNILAVLRALCREGPQRAAPTWQAVIEHACAALFLATLDSSRFDNVEV